MIKIKKSKRFTQYRIENLKIDVNIGNHGNIPHCSVISFPKDCYKDKIPIPCDYCGDITEKPFSLINKLNFCDYDCKNLYQEDNMIGENNPFYGKNHKEESKRYGSDNVMYYRTGDKNPFYGKTHTDETKEILRVKCPNHGKDNGMYDVHLSQENHWNWQGGISNNTYPLEFNRTLKNKIRERDNKTCQLCFIHQDNLDYTLSVHHKDYNKQNSDEDNLISLCISCHMKTNYNRKYWQQYFQVVI